MGPAFCSSYRTTFSGRAVQPRREVLEDDHRALFKRLLRGERDVRRRDQVGGGKERMVPRDGGSVSKTSIPAPAITPSDSAFASAALSTTGRAPC